MKSHGRHGHRQPAERPRVKNPGPFLSPGRGKATGGRWSGVGRSAVFAASQIGARVIAGVRGKRLDAARQLPGVSEAIANVGPVSYEASLQHISRAAVCLLVEANLALGVFFPSISSTHWILHLWKVPPIPLGPMVLGNMDVGINTQNLAAILLVIFLSVVNIFGLKTGAIIQNIFTAAKVSHLAFLPQGAPERTSRALKMVRQMDAEGFGNCTNTYECEAVCPAEISASFIAKLNREYAQAVLRRSGGE